MAFPRREKRVAPHEMQQVPHGLPGLGRWGQGSGIPQGRGNPGPHLPEKSFYSPEQELLKRGPLRFGVNSAI